LKIHINHLASLVDGTPQIVLLATDLHGPAHRARGNGEDFINEESISAATVLSS